VSFLQSINISIQASNVSVGLGQRRASFTPSSSHAASADLLGDPERNQKYRKNEERWNKEPAIGKADTIFDLLSGLRSESPRSA
jgi:hypothetical protein